MSQPTHIIDPDGEVIILLRNENFQFAPLKEDVITEPVKEGSVPEDKPVPEEAVEEFRIQVSAKHLTLASPYFKSLLTSRWKESIAYFEKAHTEVSMEDCSIEALLILLRVIHCQYYQVPKTLSFEMLAEVASLTDYYKCREAVDVLAERWIIALEENIPTSYSRDVILWMWISWFFNLPVQFKQATSTAMTCSNGLIVDLGLPIPQHILGKKQTSFLLNPTADEIAGLLNDRRQKAIGNLFDLVQETHEAFLNGARGCDFECSSIMYGALAKNMFSKGFSQRAVIPYPKLSYKSLLQTVLSFDSPKWGGSRPHRHSCSDSSFLTLFNHLDGSIEGLDIYPYFKS
jgi:hypothetical protein